LVSGNQMNSLDVSLSFPLPVLDQGHAQRAAASARVASAGAQERALTASAEVAASQLRLRLELAGVRQRALTEESLPLARRTLEALERASERSLVPVTDVLTAKRALAELRAAELDCLQDRFESAVSLLALTRPSGAATQGRNGR
jgi:cobalt-zinc-cadmium efflux system outer membrane protein